MEKIVLEDESLRDGLQAESQTLPLETKVSLFHKLVGAGLQRIQVGSFVHPKIVPQLSDTDALIALVKDTPEVLLTGLALNKRGLERAVSCGLPHISLSSSVSNSHSLRNVKQTRKEALDTMITLIKQALDSGLAVRAGAQCAFGCVYEGKIEEDLVFDTIGEMTEAGAAEFNLADTSGMANPKQVEDLVTKVVNSFPGVEFSLHLHDTRGFAIANMVAGYNAGIRLFDTCTGGLGGCPFVDGAAGNIATEDAALLFETMGIETGIDIPQLCEVKQMYQTLLNRELPGRICRVLSSDSC